MTISARVTLRYFPVLGRAQALRHALADRRIEFEDVRTPLTEWSRHRENAIFAGPFRALPTLSWADTHVAEALPIASFIAKRSGQYEGIGDGAIAHIEAVCSCCYIDVMLRIAEIVHADLLYPGADTARSFAVVAPRMMQKMDLLEHELLADEWFGGKQPVIADFFAAETIEVLAYALGPSRRAALVARLPRLTDLARRVRARPSLAKAEESRPARFTARHDEDVIIERMSAADLSAAGL